MDFFQRVGNFFTGAGWVSDDEERKKKRQQQLQAKKVVKQRTPQQNKAIENMVTKAQKPANNGVFNLDKPEKKPQVPQPPQAAKPPVVKAAPQPTFQPAAQVKPKQFKYDDKEADALKTAFKQGRFKKEDYVKYTRERANRANKAMTNGKVSVGNVAGAVADTLYLDDIRKVKEQNKVSYRATELADKGQKGMNVPLSMRGGFKPTKEFEAAIKQAEKETGVKYDPAEAQAAGLSFLANFIGAGGVLKGAKKSLEAGTELAKDGGAATVNVLKDLIERVKADSGDDAAEAVDTVRQTRTERINEREMAPNQRNADEAIRLADERVRAAADKTPAFSKKDRTVVVKAPDRNLPTPDELSEISPLVIQKRTTEEMRKVTDDPNLTPTEKKARLEEIKQLYTETMEKIEANKKASAQMVDEARAGTVKAQDAREAVIDEVKAKQVARNAPFPVEQVDEGKVFYHGTNNADLKKLSDLRAGKSAGSSGLNRVYVTENPEIAKNFGKNVISERLYGKHLNAADIGVEKTPGWAADRDVAPEFSDYKTTPLLTDRERRVFENSFVRGIPNNTIIEDTPGIHNYLVSKGYTTVTVPRVHSDVDGARTETIIISDKALEAPKPVELKPAQTKAPEADANDAYKRFNDEAGITENTDDIDYLTGLDTAERLAGNREAADLLQKQGFRIPSAVNNNTQGKVADGMSNGAGTLSGKLLTSQNPILNLMGQLAYGLNKKSTMTNEMKSAVEQINGRRGGVGEGLRRDLVAKLDEPLADMDDEFRAVSKENVFKAFELYNNGQMDEALEAIKRFTPKERAYFDNIRELNTLRNNLNRSTMSEDTIGKYDNGMHMPRIFDQDAFKKEFTPDDIETYAISQNRVLDLNPNRRRQQLEDISEEIRETMLRDPAQASAIRTDIALHNRAISEYSARIAHLPGAVADKPIRGFLEIPDNARYGSLAGKHVRRDLAEPMLDGSNRFKTDTYRMVDGLLNKYQASFFGKLENGLRKVLTVYNPATRLGNRAANLSQGSMAGFNLPEMAYKQQHYINVMKNGGNEWTRLAKAYGAIDDSEALARFSGVIGDPQRGVLKDFRKRASESYTDMDAGAKVAMFEWRVKKGDTPEQAARFVNRALPNIGNSGEIYSFFSRLPVLGIPFRAIQPEVLRALASTASRNSVPFLVAMTTYTTLQNMSWEGVPEEERKQIQERFGSGQTPFAGLNRFAEGELGVQTDKVLPSSWSFNAGGLFDTDPDDGKTDVVDVDPRRLMGMYSINTGGDSTGDSIFDTLAKVSPAPVPVTYKDGKVALAPQNIVGSRLFGAPYQALIDRDFRGKSIQDPDGKIYNEDGTTDLKYVNPETDQPESKSNLGRVGEFLARSYVPQLNDAANVFDAKEGKENFYGQEMNIPQAIGRLFGLKGEVFDKDRLKDMTATQEYFEMKEEIDREVKEMSPAAAEAYKRLTGYYKLREKVPNEFEPGELRDKKAAVYDFPEDKWKDYAAHPELYQLMVDKKQREAQKDGKPIQPEFDPRLSEGFRKQLLQNKMVAPGDDAELDQRMYSSTEYDYYSQLKDEYEEQAKKYYGEKEEGAEFVDELVKHKTAKFPKKPDVLKAYGQAYEQYTKGLREKPAFNDELKAAKQEYNKATFDWTNNERKSRGLPAITWDMWNNPTFGYDESPSGGGSGWGFGGGGGGRAPSVNTLGDLSSFASDVARLKEVETQAMPQLEQMVQTLLAGSGGGRQKPRLGASSRGQG